jgi:2-polyprenyl-3-methyl-5-hydroxy-6-metoxy-1,4-benzoquinol methylase
LGFSWRNSLGAEKVRIPEAHPFPGIPAGRFSLYDQNKDLLIKKLLGTEWLGRRALDLGCGPGLFCSWLADCGAEVTGVDRNPGILETARGATHGRVRFLAKDIIEHVSDEEALACVIRRSLKPGGSLLISTHNTWSLQYLLAGSIGLLHGRKYLGMDGDHVRMYSPTGLLRFLRKSGARPMAWLGCYHLPYRLLGGRWKERMDLNGLHFLENSVGTRKPFCFLGWSLTVLAEACE